MRYQMMLAPIAAQKSESAQLGRVTIGPSDPASHLVRTFDLAPLQGASLWWMIPRVETLGYWL